MVLHALEKYLALTLSDKLLTLHRNDTFLKLMGGGR